MGRVPINDLYSTKKETCKKCRWPLPNNVDNPAYDQESLTSSLPMMGINLTDLNDMRDSYNNGGPVTLTVVLAF
jgi:hypothetical protein